MEKKKKEKKNKYRFLKILVKFFAGLFIFILLLLLFIRSPWGQNIIKNQVVKNISSKTDTEITLDKLFITFSGNIQLDGLYLEDKKGDTLVYSKSLEADIPIWPIIQGNAISVDNLDWEGLKANIVRKDSLGGFNYEFLMEAFATDSTQTTQQPAPQDTTAAQEINIGNINLKDFNITYKDNVMGIDTQLSLGELILELEKTDLEKMDFRAENASISNTQITYLQNKPFPAPENEEPAPMPYLVVDNFNLENVQVSYNSVPDGINANIDIKKFLAEVPLMDLKSQEIEVNEIALQNSEIKLEMQSIEKSQDTTAAKPSPFTWPKWKVSVDKIDFSENNLSYLVDDAEPKKGEFNAEALVLDSLNFNANNLFLKDKRAGAQVTALNFKEASGLNLNELHFNLNFEDTQSSLSELVVALNGNQIKGEASLNYNSVQELIANYETAELSVNLPTIMVDVKEAFRFQPDLRSNPYMKELASNKVSGNLKASGKLSAIGISRANFNWKNTSFSVNGNIYNAANPDNISFDIPRFNAKSRKSDLTGFVSEKDLGISIPKNIQLSGNFKGSPEDLSAKAFLQTSEGNIRVDGNFTNKEEIAFQGKMTSEKLQLGNLLQNESLGALNLELETTGSGSTVNTLDATLDATITSFSYNNYEINDLNISGNIENGSGNIASSYKDENLELELNSQVELDSVKPKANLNLNLKGARLQELGLASRDIRLGFKLDAAFEGNAEEYITYADFTEAVVVYDNSTYLPGDLNAQVFVLPDSTSVQINNKILALDLKSNADPADFTAALNRHYESYFNEVDPLDTLRKPVNLKLRGTIKDAPVLNEVFLSNLEQLDTIQIEADFNEKERKLDALVSLPFINYYSSEIDSLEFRLNSDPDNFDFNLGFKAINSGPIAIQKTDFSGSLSENKLLLDFTSMQGEERLFHVASEITKPGNNLRFHINPEDLILNKKEWNIAAENEMLVYDEEVSANNFRLTRNDQEMILSDELSYSDKNHIGLEFKNFNLGILLNYLNSEEKLASGQLNGHLVFEDPLQKIGILAGLEINQLNVMEVALGKLSLNSTPKADFLYNVGLAIKGDNVDLDMKGDIQALDSTTVLDMKMDINKVRMKTLEGFSMGAITNGEGSLSGNLTLGGTTTEPEYNGELQFDEAKIRVALLNAPFTFPSEKLEFDNQGVYFDEFRVEDKDSNSFVVNGEVLIENLLNPEFDLDLRARNFQVLNSTKEDNELFYGTATFDSDATLTGDLNVPNLDMDITIGSNTNFTYVMPEEELAMQERDGIVIFTNREDPDDILTANEEEESATLTGYNINALININEEAAFNIIIDEQTGDNFRVKGEGELDFNISPNGRMTLAGRYTMSGGHYEMSLYNLVKRRFEIAEGSRITWAGDPFDATLDVSAIYRVETSPASLMAAGDGNQFRRDLPFLVYLNVGGELMQPKLSFGLQMPEEERGSVGGEVYGRLQQLNSQEAELNKQVFSLLVLNRFYPSSNNAGDSGGNLSIARDNLNQALADQLNMFSDKLLGDTGVQLNFGVDSYTDYQGSTATQRTQVDIEAQKSLLDDRLIVSVGSEVGVQGGNRPGEEASPLIGNVSIEYLLTENGRFRLKGFRRNEFENVIDGQLIVSGIAFIFTREFNEFQELWDNFFLKEEEENTIENNEEEK
ncbi:Autotransporter translocation and assembly factor TamB [Salegentibacter holothuriorum]|uniref:Autotransporter translocation and assembly factor TamB n=1 Tax=Salegentibacter holothuriorum TaxID=241145 RepID=A0A1T5AE15_9FLAO|nr:translocation/assembly module TamB domain-containing protein [Salegentibacter holothuriorum]SKB33251.1 Autotransporter translocation and assembly factor TamB [Salegentibacter holothuriorum]